MRARFLAAVVALVVLVPTVVAGAAGAAPVDGDVDANANVNVDVDGVGGDVDSLGAGPTSPAQVNDSAANGTSQPTIADGARLVPVKFDREYLQTRRSGERQYNVTGPYAVFAVTQGVESATVRQPGASAKVMSGGRTVRVAFDRDAAAANQTSFFEVRLYFADDSQLNASLFVTGTDQVVAPASLTELSGFLATVRTDASDQGYDTDADGLDAYYTDTKEQAEILNNLFGPQLEKFGAWLIVTATTPLAIIVLAVLAVLVAVWILRNHEEYIRELSNGYSLARQRYEESMLRYRDDQRAAAQHRLGDVDEIGHDDMVWQDALGVSTVQQLADLAAKGRRARTEDGRVARDGPAGARGTGGDATADANGDGDGEVLWHHHGVEDLTGVDSLRDTWLEPVLRRDMLADETQALAHVQAALERMVYTYNQPQYRPALERVRGLLDDASVHESVTGRGDDVTHSFSGHGGRGPTGGPSSVATGGDD
jgi:hypothetical protein